MKKDQSDAMNHRKAAGGAAGQSRNKKPVGEANPKNRIFLGRLLCGLCADLCVFARNSFPPIWGAAVIRRFQLRLASAWLQ